MISCLLSFLHVAVLIPYRKGINNVFYSVHIYYLKLPPLPLFPSLPPSLSLSLSLSLPLSLSFHPSLLPPFLPPLSSSLSLPLSFFSSLSLPLSFFSSLMSSSLYTCNVSSHAVSLVPVLRYAAPGSHVPKLETLDTDQQTWVAPHVANSAVSDATLATLHYPIRSSSVASSIETPASPGEPS